MNYLFLILLSILWPGLGQLFIKNTKKGGIFIIMALLVHIVFYTFLCFNTMLFVISYFVFGIIQAIALIDSIRTYRKNKKAQKLIFGFLLLFSSLLIIKFVYLDNIVKLYRYRHLTIPSSAMTNTLRKNDRVLCDFSKNYKNKIKRGNIIVYINGNNDIIFFRCIAIENDKINIINDNVYLNGILLEEKYKNLNVDLFDEAINYDLPESVIEKDMVFLLGDNRYNSMDSRFIGQIPKDRIIGKFLFKYFSEN
jgi:signal peptidase I